MIRNRLKVALVLAFCVAAPNAAHAAGEQNGRIEGTITEAASGAPVPGATISISGPKLIGGAQVVTSRDDGRYEAVELPPGRYDVEVSYAGVKPIKRRVVVRQGETAPLDISWSPELAEAEVTVVVEERHMTKPDSTQTGTVLSSESEGKIAMGDRRYQFFAQQVAGVSPDPQNSALFQNVHGGNFLSNRYLIDGLDLTDPASNTFSANINLDLVASEEVLTGGMEAQYNSLGGVFNLITNGGSDEWHVDASLYINNSAFSAANHYGNQAAFNGYQQFNTRDSPPSQKYQANVNFGGPILKHRLWFNVSAEYFYEEASLPAGSPIVVQHPSFYRHQFLGHLKLTWAPNDKHRITLSAHTDPAWLNNIGTRFYGTNNYSLGIAEQAQNQGGAFVTLAWDYFKSQNINVGIQAGFQWNYVNYGPQGIIGSGGVDYGPTDQYAQLGYSMKNTMYNPNQARHYNFDDNTIWYQGDVYVQQPRYRVSLDPSVSLRGNAAGYHDAKIGIQSTYVYSGNTQHYPGNAVYSDLNGGPLEGGLCNENYMGSGMAGGTGCFQRTLYPDFENHQDGFGVGLFVQDRWKPFKRLTISPGIRFDYGYTRNSIGETVSSLFGVGPRLGFTFDLTGDQKTIFTAYYGRANDTLVLYPAGQAEPTPPSTTQQYDAASNTWNLLYQSGGSGGYRLDPNLTTPHTDEVVLGLRREVFRDSVAAIEYTYKRTSNLWDGVEINQIWDPSGTRVVGYVDGQPHQILKITTPDNNYRIYQGIDFSVESRPTPNWDLYAAYTLSWLYGPGAEQFGQISGAIAGSSANYNPRQTQFFDGFLPEDRRHSLKARASYSWHGLTVGALLFYFTGTPISKLFFNQNDAGYTNRRAPQGLDPGLGSAALSTPNNLAAASEFRTPDQLQIDFRIGYDFHALIKQHLILMADFFNLLNLSTPAGFDNTNTTTFGTVQGRQAPFRFEIGLRYVY